MQFTSLPWRRILSVLIFLVAVFVIGFLLYLAFFAPSREPAANNGLPSNGQLPTVNGGVNRTPSGNANRGAGLPIAGTVEPPSAIANGGPTVANNLIDTPSNYLGLAGNGVDLIFYDPISGKFYQVSPTGAERRSLNDRAFKGVSAVAWAPSRDRAVLTFQDGSNIVYDFGAQRQVTSLPSELENFSFSPDSSKLAAKFIGPSSGDNWLAVVNADGSAARTIEPLGDKESRVQVNWSPNGQILATYQQSVDGERQEIVLLGQNDENFKTIETEGRGFVGQYDRTGTRLLYSVHSSTTAYNPELYIVQASGDAIGQNNLRLGLSTWASKCAFNASGGNVYCAVPMGLSPGSGLYPELADDVPYEFVKVNVATGSQQRLARPTDAGGTSQYAVDRVFLSATEDYLYFTDPDGRIRTIRLR